MSTHNLKAAKRGGDERLYVLSFLKRKWYGTQELLKGSHHIVTSCPHNHAPFPKTPGTDARPGGVKPLPAPLDPARRRYTTIAKKAESH
jgi:hypothetical protein